MDEKELTTKQTAQEPKKPTKKKSTKKQEQPTTEQTTPESEIFITETVQQPVDAPEQTTSENWNFYNQLHSIETKESHGGSNKTHPVRRRAQKRAHKTRIQKESRRINRYIK